MTNSNQTTTLVGYLGKDRIERDTAVRTYTTMVPDPILDGDLVERDFTTRSRPYLKLSLATHAGCRTTWHDLILWHPDHHSGIHPAKLARRGDKVEVVGRFETYTFQTSAGEVVSRSHFVVDQYRCLKRRKSPEIP